MEFERSQGDGRAWETRTAGRLVLHVRPGSLAARDVDQFAARYVEALAAVSEALDVDADALPTVAVYLDDLSADEPAISSTVADEGVSVEPSTKRELTIWTAYGNESPAIEAEVDIARALLAHSYGIGQAAARFWDEGFAGYAAAKSGRSSFHAEADDHCRHLLHEGALPPIMELIAESEDRVSAVDSTAACAFARYLIERYGLERYQRLLRAARTDPGQAFGTVYSTTLALADRDWRRHLEATDGEAHPGLWHTLRRLFPIARPYWRSGLAVLACSLVGVAFSLAMPLAFRFLIDNILARRPLSHDVPFVGETGHVVAAGREQLDVLVLLLTALGVLYALNAAARLGMTLLLGKVGESFSFDLRSQMVGILERLPAAYFARGAPADISERIVHDVEVVQGTITRAAVPMVSGVVSIVCFAALLFALEPKLAAIPALGLPVVALIHAYRRNGRRAAARERVRRISNLATGVNEAATAHALAKLYRAGAYVSGRLLRRMEEHRQLNTAFGRENAMLAQSGTLVLGLIQVAVLLVGGYLIIVSNGEDLAPGSLVAFYIVLNQMLGPIGQVSTATQSVAGASASVERAAALLEVPPEGDSADARSIGPLRRELTFEGVTFDYGDDKPVLKNVSLAIKAGQTVAFVGPSGAGKSSILQLLPRLFDPTAGSISWDGVDLRSVSLDALREQIGMVQQDPLLLNATVYDNIRFGAEWSSDDAVRRAAHSAAADEVIRALPHGYDTVVGQGGVGLSGGQRQRISLARALLRRPSLLILDEATSALDATTQRVVQEQLRDHGQVQTIIKVAHRLETVVDADTIFVLDEGELVEWGAHAGLLASDGLYARLVADQTAPLHSASPPNVGLAVHRLRGRTPFSHLPSAILDALGRRLEPVEVSAGRELYHQGDESDALYVLMRGNVELQFSSDSRRQIVERVDSVNLLGDQSFLTRRARPATAMTLTDVSLYRLSRESWEAVRRAARRSRDRGVDSDDGTAAPPRSETSGVVRSRPPSTHREGRTTSDRPPTRIARPRDS
jgi:ABC-type multidrug transport system fused ATPase/permease subunit